MPKRIETNIDPVPEAVFEIVECLKNSKSTDVQLLAVMYCSLARKMNLLLHKLEYGDVIVSDVAESEAG